MTSSDELSGVTLATVTESLMCLRVPSFAKRQRQPRRRTSTTPSGGRCPNTIARQHVISRQFPFGFRSQRQLSACRLVSGLVGRSVGRLFDQFQIALLPTAYRRFSQITRRLGGTSSIMRHGRQAATSRAVLRGLVRAPLGRPYVSPSQWRADAGRMFCPSDARCRSKYSFRRPSEVSRRISGLHANGIVVIRSLHFRSPSMLIANGIRNPVTGLERREGHSGLWRLFDRYGRRITRRQRDATYDERTFATHLPRDKRVSSVRS